MRAHNHNQSKRISFPILDLPRRWARIACHSISLPQGALGRCQARSPGCLYTVVLERGLCLSHCIAKRPDGINKLSGVGSHRRGEQTVFGHVRSTQRCRNSGYANYKASRLHIKAGSPADLSEAAFRRGILKVKTFSNSDV